MRYVVVGVYSATLEFMRERGLAQRDIIPVPQAGPLGQALAGLNPWEVTIVIVREGGRYMDPAAMDWLRRYQAQGARVMVEG